MANRAAGCMGKPLVRFCEGPRFNEGQDFRGIGHVVVACDEAFSESPVEHLINDHLETSVYSKMLHQNSELLGEAHYSIIPLSVEVN